MENKKSQGNVMVNQLNDKRNRRKFSSLWTTKEIWDATRETYSSSDNILELFEIEAALHDLMIYTKGNSLSLNTSTLSLVIGNILICLKSTHGNALEIQLYTKEFWSGKGHSNTF